MGETYPWARSYSAFSNALWSVRNLQSVGQRYSPKPFGMSFCSHTSISISSYSMFFSKPTSVMAKGVRLNGAFGFSEFLHNKMYSFCAWFTFMSDSRGRVSALASRAISWVSHPTMSLVLFSEIVSNLERTYDQRCPTWRFRRHPWRYPWSQMHLYLSILVAWT